ncbi:MAG: serine hydrolase, partial [Acidobacteriota bacterium]
MTRQQTLCSIFALVGLLGCASPPQESPGSPSVTLSAVGKRLDDYLSRLEPFGFAGTVLVAEGEQTHLDAGYGYADRETAIPNAPDTVFQVASITKQFTAAAIMALAVDGKLRTTDTLPTFFSDVPVDKESITLRQLLSHTSGVLAGDTEYFEDNSRSEIVAMVLAEPLRFAPGESFLYSNMGYALLAAVIEKVSGTSYEDYLRQRLLLPAGMRSTGYRLSSWQPTSVAHWYANGVDNGDQLDHLYPDWNFIGSGRIRSTTGDMLRWHRALMSDELLPATAKQEMYTPVMNDYAYGWVVRDTDRGRVIRHNGASSDGAAAEFRRYVDEDLVIVAFSNVDGEQMLFGNRLADHIDDLAHGIELDLPPRVSADTGIDLEPFAGLYRTDSGSEIEIELRRDMLVARGRGQSAVDALYGGKRLSTGETVSEQAQEALVGLVE